MPGKRLLLDTNALIALLKGNQSLLDLTSSAEWVGISVISILEFSSFSGMTSPDLELLREFEAAVAVVDLAHTDQALIQLIAQTRLRTKLKLPDAIILASAALNEATLITNDAQLLKFSSADPTFAAQEFGI
jgi:tRNA(fMet)-specific endonuclease VapC